MIALGVMVGLAVLVLVVQFSPLIVLLPIAGVCLPGSHARAGTRRSS